jgi:hypothetical protein
VEIGTNFVPLTCAKGMTLGTTRLEKLSTGLGVTYRVSQNEHRSLEHARGYLAYQEHKASLLNEGTEKGSNNKRWRKVVGGSGRVAATWVFKKGFGVADQLSRTRVYP